MNPASSESSQSPVTVSRNPQFSKLRCIHCAREYSLQDLPTGCPHCTAEGTPASLEAVYTQLPETLKSCLLYTSPSPRD